MWDPRERVRKYKILEENKLERFLDKYNHTMELIRTILPIAIIIMQCIILWKIG